MGVVIVFTINLVDKIIEWINICKLPRNTSDTQVGLTYVLGKDIKPDLGTHFLLISQICGEDWMSYKGRPNTGWVLTISFGQLVTLC